MLKGREETEARYADTQQFRKDFKSCIRFVRDFFWCKTVVWLPAHNNLRYIFLPLFLLSRVLGKNLVYVVVGGWLTTLLKRLPLHRRLLRHVRGILAENDSICEELKAMYGYKNVEKFPNFRNEEPEPFAPEAPGDKLRMVFMARITRKKGLDTIAALLKWSELNGLQEKICIDLYGPICEDEEYLNKEILQPFPTARYRGLLSPDQINHTLRKYDVMLFPTRYYTEGFPGTVLDAYRAGIPVIATRWKHATEFIRDRETGFVVPFDDPLPGMERAISELSSKPSLLGRLKENAYQESFLYTPRKAWDIIKRYV